MFLARMPRASQPRPKLMKIKADVKELPDYFSMDWHLVETAPFDRDLELAVIDGNEIHTLVFPCRRRPHGWVNAKTNASIGVHPTHWREWDDSLPTGTQRARSSSNRRQER